MSATPLHNLLRTFRWHVAAIRLIRVAALLSFMAVMLWASGLDGSTGHRAAFLFAAAGVVLWILLMLDTIRRAREVQAGSILVATGQLDRAEQWLRDSLQRFSLSLQAKIMACQQLASLYFRKEAHQDVVAICRVLLRQRLGSVRNALINTRLMLSDSLLMLDRVSEAYEAMRPVYDTPLSLADRMKLLPIQLRYELAADHAASAVQGLPEKVQIAELLDSPRAALVHALLAEACRRQSMPRQHEFLARRARLYHDIEPIIARYAVIAPAFT